MSATKDIKKDPVIEMLKSELESNSKNELVKMLLYANPNGSGIQDGTQPVYKKLAERISLMNRSPAGEFDYTDLELPTKSVSLPIRIRFAIEELVGALEMLNLARTRIHVENMNGGSWPSSNIVVGGTSVKVGLQFIKSMKAIVRDYLITQLPALIHDCYEAQYKNAGNFSYSLLETKLYAISPDVMQAFIKWVQTVVLVDYINSPLDTPIFTTILNKTGDIVPNVPTRTLMLDEMWVDTTVVKTTGEYKYPPHYVKLCKVICARLGKLLRTPFSATEDWALEGPDAEAKYNAARTFVNYCLEKHFNETGKSPSQAITSPGSRKKDFQRAIYEILLNSMNTAHTKAHAKAEEVRMRSGVSVVKAFIRHEVISLIYEIRERSSGIGYQRSLVYLDSLESSVKNVSTGGEVFYSFAPCFTKGQFLESLNKFQSGVCNPRVMESFYRFISTHSLSQRDSSRKKIPEEIEVEILRHADLTRFENDLSGEPALCFSQASLEKADKLNSKIAQVRDKTNLDGLRQNGVMSLTAALKNKARSAAIDQNHKDMDALLADANIVDEVADCYVMVYEALFEARKAMKAKEAAAQRQHSKNTVRAGASTYTFVASSPIVGSSPTVQGLHQSIYTSPVVGAQEQNLFTQSEVPVETQYAPSQQAYSSVQTAPSMFSTLPQQGAEFPMSSGSNSLFNGQAASQPKSASRSQSPRIGQTGFPFQQGTDLSMSNASQSPRIGQQFGFPTQGSSPTPASFDNDLFAASNNR